MDVADRLGLVRIVLEDHGIHVEATEPRGDHHDLRTPVRPILRRREAIVRVAYVPLTGQHVDDLDRLSVFEQFADAVLVDASGTNTGVTGTERVQVITTDELIAMIEDTGAASWNGDTPVADPSRVAQRRRLAETPPLTDRIGLEVLVPLSWMALPAPLTGAPEDLFEFVVFRIFTASLSFGGQRLGSSRRGLRAADAILELPNGNADALLDCKAARDGYTMGADNERALREYVTSVRSDRGAASRALRWVLIVSSDFPGSGDRHPYVQRSQSMEADDVQLVYLRADQLLEIAVSVELAQLQPSQRAALPWPDLFGTGFVSDDAVAAFLQTFA